jgi:hypothetical protein
MPVNWTRDVIARWPDGEPAHAELLRMGGVQAVISPNVSAPFREACAKAGIQVINPESAPILPLKEYTAHSGGFAALNAGLWPGVTRGPQEEGRGDETASASREPWVDGNGFWIAWQRAMFPQRPAVLAYEGDFKEKLVPYDSHELALIDAQVMGGNYLLSLDPRYRKALLAGEAKALEAWKTQAKTAAWLKANAALWGQPIPPTITLLVEEGEETPELANLMFRRTVSPCLVPAAKLPAPDPVRRLAVVAANLNAPSPEVRRQIMAHAAAGTTVIADEPWALDPKWKAERSEQDRKFYTVGKGQVVIYNEKVVDPSEFALDVIDLVSHRKRPARIWNAPAAMAWATACPENSPVRGKALAVVVNYGQALDSDFPVRVQGHHPSATLLRPDASPTPLKAARRGSTTEVFIPELKRLGVVVFG